MKTLKHKGKLTRTYSIRGADVDSEARSVEVAFSSEEPVERFFGTEILDHRAESVRMGRLSSGGPLLVDHDPTDHIGVIERAEIGTDRRGRAVVRFGKSARASEVYQDVKDGIRHNISVGYQIHRMEEDGKDTYRAVDWEPHEISIVSIPADASVGVGRTYDDEEYSIELKEDEVMADAKTIEAPMERAPDVKQVQPDPAAIREQAEKLAREISEKRLTGEKAIRAAGKAHGLEDIAESVIESGGSMQDFNDQALAQYRSSVKPVNNSVADPDTGKDKQRYSLTRLYRHLSNPQDRQAAAAAAFEIEVSDDIAKRSKGSAQGAYVPDFAFKRELTAGTATDGAELVATNLLAERFIDVLRNVSAVGQANATVLDGLRGDVAIPRKTTASAAAWIATESGDAALSEPQFDQVTLTPKTLGVYAEYSRQLFLQSTPSIDGLLQDDLSRGVALAIDLAALRGDGLSGAPTGVRSTGSVNTSTITVAGNPDWDEIVAFRTAVASDNALLGSQYWITNAAVVGAMMVKEKATNTGMFILDGEGNNLMGRSLIESEQCAASEIYFGNFADLLIGMWGGRDVLVDPYTNGLSGAVRIVSLQSIDCAVRHPESFCINA